jgi:hypothetical protein
MSVSHTDEESSSREYKLLSSLARELFQTEQSAATHCRREAHRLGSCPPAWALLAVAEHATEVLDALPAVAERHGMPVSAGGRIVGKVFSAVRHLFADRVIEAERSYRGTLLGIRHGVDVMRLLEHVAMVLNDAELANWCEDWLDTRNDLVARVEEGLAWFARHPEEATRSGVAQLVAAR